MIAPIDSLSFSIHSNPGIYAVLVGSGISRSAKIPTGWDITLDLVRKVAAVTKEDCGENPEAWYRAKFGKEPDYSVLLDELAKSPAERQQLLKAYWEPTEEDRENGAKQPTRAHRAIAELAAKGFIRVIITTNFDKLIETALADAGVIPTILSTPDSIDGALPLIHAKCTLIKVHGDYLDTRIKNTLQELESYDPKFNALLDRVFDEFGLIVCGWSADWDKALRTAITRAPSRRYSMYWAARSKPQPFAQELIEQRQAIQLQINDADGFFSSVAEKVQSLVDFSRPHPLSTAVAVASLKRFLSEPKFRIQHDDLIAAEVEHATDQLNFEKFPPLENSQALTSEFLTKRVRSYEAIMQTVLAMAAQAGYWSESMHHRVWARTIARLASAQPPNFGVTTISELQKYPAALTFYCLGLGGLEADRLDFLAQLCDTIVSRETRPDELAVNALTSATLIQTDSQGKLLEGMEKRRTPISDWMHNVLQVQFKWLFPTEEKYTYSFDRLEILLALAYSARRKESWYWVPVGAFGHRHQNRMHILDEIFISLNSKGTASPYIGSGLLGANVEKARDNIELLKQHTAKLN